MDGFAVLEALRADVSERFLLILVLTRSHHRGCEGSCAGPLAPPVSWSSLSAKRKRCCEFAICRKLTVLTSRFDINAALEEAVRERTAGTARENCRTRGCESTLSEFIHSDQRLGSAPGGGRTHNLWLRRPTLYPVELRARQTAIIIRRFYNHKRANLLFAELGPK